MSGSSMGYLSSQRHQFHVFGLFLFLSLLGCSSAPEQTDVSGTVTYNGKPLNASGGKITFFGPDNFPVAADINSDGTFHVNSVRVGENKVAVLYPNPRFKRSRAPAADGSAAEPQHL